MKCPLIFGNYMVRKGFIKSPDTDCLKEECAWWDNKLKLCSITALALETDLLSETMTHVLAKLSREKLV